MCYMMKLRQQTAVVMGWLVTAGVAAGQNLFAPPPADRLRPMNTDRPDKTESPYTVDAGHFQVESDLANYRYDRDPSGGGDPRTESWSFATLNLKAGLRENTDLQIVLEPHNRIRREDRRAGTVRRQSGFGDVTVRLKQNFWGNNGGRTAFGVMPFVKFPTSQDDLGNDAVEGGIIFPLAVKLPRGWDMGLMTEVDWLRDVAGSGRHPSFVNSITCSHDLIGALTGYAEFFSEVGAESGSRWVGTVDLGLTYGLTQNIQLDAGINLGVTDAADDLNPFVGVSWRL